MKRRERKILFAALLAAVVFSGCGVEKAKEAAAADAAARAAETLSATETPEATETPTPEVKEEEITMYTLDNTPLREKASKQSETLEKLAVNVEVKVLGEDGRFCHVKADGREGYVLAKKLTLDKDEALEAEKKIQEKEAAALAQAEAERKAAEEAAAEEAAAAEAARAAEEAAAQGDAVQELDTSDGITEVETQREVIDEDRFDDCDGSGHGYKIVYYSDGTKETVEY